MSAEYERMREAVAEQYGFALYRQYAEKEAAGFIKIDLSTLKRWRRAGRVDHIKLGVDGVRYLGIQIADIILRGTKPWDDPTPEHPNGPIPD